MKNIAAAGVDTGSASDTSVDEWPPASTDEGGKGAELRYVTIAE